MKVVYSRIALLSLQELMEFLEQRWTFREIQILNKDLEKLLKTLEDKIISYPISEYDSKLRYALIGKKQIKVFFELTADRVDILLFWPNRKDPQQLKFLLESKPVK